MRRIPRPGGRSCWGRGRKSCPPPPRRSDLLAGTPPPPGVWAGWGGEPVQGVPQAHERSQKGNDDERDHNPEADESDSARLEQGPVLEEELPPTHVLVADSLPAEHPTASRAGPGTRTTRPRPCSPES